MLPPLSAYRGIKPTLTHPQPVCSARQLHKGIENINDLWQRKQHQQRDDDDSVQPLPFALQVKVGAQYDDERRKVQRIAHHQIAISDIPIPKNIVGDQHQQGYDQQYHYLDSLAHISLV